MVRFLPEKKDFRNGHNSDESISLQRFKDLPLLLTILIRSETIYESSMLHKIFNNDENPKRSMNFFILINIYMENSVDDRLQSLLFMQNFHRIKSSSPRVSIENISSLRSFVQGSSLCRFHLSHSTNTFPTPFQSHKKLSKPKNNASKMLKVQYKSLSILHRTIESFCLMILSDQVQRSI